jgi:hypothetical protein
MKKLNLLLLLLLPLLFACENKCEGLECISENAFAFTIQSAESGHDLLFGNHATLAVDEVEVYYMMNGSKQSAQVQVIPGFVDVYLAKGVREYYVSALGETDTIRVDFTEIPASECCPTTIQIDQRTVNDRQMNPDEWLITLSR